jgi:signal transduction histidine kinase
LAPESLSKKEMPVPETEENRGEQALQTTKRVSLIRLKEMINWHKSMRMTTGPVLLAAFSTFLTMISLSAWVLLRKTMQIDRDTTEIQVVYGRADDALAEIRSGVYQASVLVQGYLLTADSLDGPPFQEIEALRRTIEQHLRELESVHDRARLGSVLPLRSGVGAFWESLKLLLAPGIASQPTSELLKQKALQRERLLKIMEEIDKLNTAKFDTQKTELNRRRREFSRFLVEATLVVLAFGLLIARGSMVRISRLELRSAQQKERAERAEIDLRRLSQELIASQEQERKTISRELHDEIGQMLTGLRMELGTLDHLHANHDPSFDGSLQSVKNLTEQTLRTVRDMAQLLRPSTLDDLGIGPALRSQAREFSRRSGVPIALQIDGDLNCLPEKHSTCLYRIVQEALTNCARHAQARQIRVVVRIEPDLVSVAVEDDGRGFQGDGLRSQGLGLIGIQERARELNGIVDVASEQNRGTRVQVRLPLRAKVEI